MKYHTKLLVIFLFSVFVIFPAQKSQAAMTGFVKLTNPVGGEVYNDGDTVTIKWDSSPNIFSKKVLWLW